MYDILIAPGAPAYTMALAGALLALLGPALADRRPRPAGPGGALSDAGRLVAGQAAGLTLAALLAGLVVASGQRGSARSLLLCGALAAYLGLGVVLPRLPRLRREREAAELRRLTPGFISFVRVALGSFEAPI
ncbi:MAG: hypothetical protein HGA45_44485, partial [Chloroflexales bacterium]|nr:hypothetical protein [Chloroflexales bacterium]